MPVEMEFARLQLSRSVSWLGLWLPTFVRAAPAAMAWWLVRYRVRISIVLFATLIFKDVFSGVRPHDIVDSTDLFGRIGLALVLVGLAIRSWAAGVLHKLDELATTGPYQLIRHPLYAGSLAMMIGVCFIIGSWENIIIAPAITCLIYVLQVRSEERKLAAQFGEAWTEYARRTGRLIPIRLSWPKPVVWRLKQWLKNREHRALGATLLGLAALKAWHALHPQLIP